MPYLVGMSGFVYLVGAVLLNLRFMWFAIKLQRTESDVVAIKMFVFSITYLMLLFAFLLLDHYSLTIWKWVYNLVVG